MAFIGVALALIAMALSPAALAQEPYRWAFRQAQIENDLFPSLLSPRRDRFYTSGVRVSFGDRAVAAEADVANLPFWLRPVRKHCTACRIHPNFSVGQQIFTPDNIDNPAPQPGDRPWAAWLYAGIGGGIDTSDFTRHNVEIQVGITGDVAGGEYGQELLHEIIDDVEPQGWDNQLGPDPGLNAYYELQHIWRRREAGHGTEWDLVPSISAAVGTMTTYAGIGGTFRVGRNISDFPYASQHSNERPTVARAIGQMEIYGFIGIDARAVAYDYFLEGSLFDNDGVTIDPERYVWDFTIGFTAKFRRFNLTYAIIRRSEEFERNLGTDRGIHSYASVSLTVGML
ncbi:MAG: lipid A deacylase LpxR family protein [Gammaproteobacteria bacterium]